MNRCGTWSWKSDLLGMTDRSVHAIEENERTNPLCVRVLVPFCAINSLMQ